MAYFLRYFSVPDGETNVQKNVSAATERLVKNVIKSSDVLKPICTYQQNRNCSRKLEEVHEMYINDCTDQDMFKLVAPPSDFGAMALARKIVFKYADYLPINQPLVRQSSSNQREKDSLANESASFNGLKVITLALNCLHSVLSDLGENDLHLCVNALQSLQYFLETIAPEQLCSEPRDFLKKLFDLLVQLQSSGSEEIGARAASCLLALAVASLKPEIFLQTLLMLLSSSCNAQPIHIPNNFRFLFLHFLKGAQCFDGQNYQQKSSFPSWFTVSLSDSSKFITFDLASSTNLDYDPELTMCAGAVASDGTFLYILTNTGLFKVGTGLSETILGHEYATNPVIKATSDSWLAVCNGSLYLRRKHSLRLWVLDSDSLREIGEVLLPAVSTQGALCSDGNGFYFVTVNDVAEISVHTVSDSFAPNKEAELTAQLFQSCYFLFGNSETEKTAFAELHQKLKVEISDVQFGKELIFLLTDDGKVFFTGIGSKIGVQKKTSSTWSELPFSERITQISVGADGSNVLFLSNSGQCWYAGEGLQSELVAILQHSRPRSEAGSEKPTRISLANHRKVSSCKASATSIALVTENGRVFIFGRQQTTHCNVDTGQVLGLETIHITQVALGKTHAVALSRHGHVYTWGLNNLYQCGRADQYGPSSRTDSEPGASASSGFQLCSPAEHLWVKDVATVCTACGLCTVHASRCPTRFGSPVKGSSLCCGLGESGCLRCGVCRSCGEHSSSPSSAGGRSDRDSDQGSERSRRLVLGPARLTLRAPVDIKIQRAACGNYHTLLLSCDGQVLSFGSNCHGQLGVGDTRRRFGSQQVPLPKGVIITDIAAGSNHSVLLTKEGLVYTFGSNRQNQLGREGKSKNWHALPGLIPKISARHGILAQWIGASGDSTLIRCQQQLIHASGMDSAIVTGNQRGFYIFRNGSKDQQAGLLHYLVLHRKSATFRHFSADLNKLNVPAESAWCLDPQYDVLWNYNHASGTVSGYTFWNITEYNLPHSTSTDSSSTTFVLTKKAQDETAFFHCPEFWIPFVGPEASISPSQLGLTALGVFYGLVVRNTEDTSALEGHLDSGKAEDFSMVSRFQNYGGGWGYSAQSIEAIQFQPSQDVEVLGFGLYGGRGEYLTRLRLLHLLGQDRSEHNLELLCETEETLYECPSKEHAHVFLAKPVICHAGSTYVAWAQINGPSSDCGAGGQTLATGDDGVTFQFRASRLSNNGTDVHVGQIPVIIYRSVSGVKMEQSCCEMWKEVMNVLPASATLNFTSGLLPTMSAYNSMFALLSLTIDSFTGVAGDQELGDSLHWCQERWVCIGLMLLRILKFLLRNPNEAVEFDEIRSKVVALFQHLFQCGQAFPDGFPMAYLYEEMLRIYVDCFSELFGSNEIILEQFLLIIKEKNRSDWELVAFLNSLTQKSLFLATIFSAEEKTAVEKSEIRDSSSNFTALLYFLVELIFGVDTLPKLQSTANSALSELVREIVRASSDNTPNVILISPSRFKRVSSQASWESATGTPDAIAFQTDCNGLSLHGICIYVGISGTYSYNLDLLLNQGDGFQEAWQILEKISGSVTVSDFGPKDKASVYFHKPVKLFSNSVYAVRLYLHGAKTWCGEGGITSVQAVNGCQIMFQSCSLSLNGSNVTRGQIPSLLYSLSTPRLHSKPSKTQPQQKSQYTKWFLQIIRLLSNKLLECLAIQNVWHRPVVFFEIFGWSGVFLDEHPRIALDVLSAVDELLPVIASWNGQRKDNYIDTLKSANKNQVIVDSDHPYKAANTESHLVQFDLNVWAISIEFDEQCSTCQNEDVISIFWSTDNEQYYPVGKFGGKHSWPKRHLMVPGHILWIVFETATCYNKNITQEQHFGFRLLVSGYSIMNSNPFALFERELVWLASSACQALALLPLTEFHMQTKQNEKLLVNRFGCLLQKGLNLSHFPSVHEVLQGSCLKKPATPETKFLNDLITGSTDTVAGKLVRWLAPDPFIDLEQCELSLNENEIVRVGQPTSITLSPKDQYGRIISNPELKIHLSVRFGETSKSSPVGTHVASIIMNLHMEAYQPTYLNKARYISISMMPIFQDFAFEELRLAHFHDTVLKESVSMIPNREGSYIGQWIPRQSGPYVIESKIDGAYLPHSMSVNVVDSNNAPIPQGEKRKFAQLSRAKMAVCSSNSATKGIRVRAAPSLKAQQVGFIPRGATISYIEEIENRTGTWLRLTDEAVLLYCESAQFPNQCWSLQYSKDLQKTHLLTEYEANASEPLFSGSHSIMVVSEEAYTVIDSDSPEKSHLLIRPSPSCTEIPIGAVKISDTVYSAGWLHNKYGIWIKLSKESCDQYLCHDTDAFCMTQDPKGHVFLEQTPQVHNTSETKIQQRLKENPALSDATDNGNFSPKYRKKMSVSTTSASANKHIVKPVKVKKPMAHVMPQTATSMKLVKATTPAVSDCIRSAFAAFIWHNGLVYDAMACGAYLKFHPDLRNGQHMKHNTDIASVNGPASLQLLAKLWGEVTSMILNKAERKLSKSSIPVRIKLNSERRLSDEQLCDLCNLRFPTPVVMHMRLAHPGCGAHSGGQGYNSLGRYSSGWTGNCGDGGRGVVTWYLLCNECRTRYKQAGSLHNNQKSSSTSIMGHKPDPLVNVKENATFLLELNSGANGHHIQLESFPTSGWTINLFPEGMTPSVASAGSVGFTNRSKTVSHTSDPGPKRQLSAVHGSIHCSEPASGYECRELQILASPSVALKTLVSSQAVHANEPVLDFLLQEHDLKKLKDMMQVAVHCSATLSHCFRVWNWILKLVSSEVSVIDILWSFLSTLASDNGINLLKHPWEICALAGRFNGAMIRHFHTFLYTVSLILRSDNADLKVRRLCFRAWMFQLTPHEQHLILGCHLLSCVGRVMTDVDSWEQDIFNDTHGYEVEKLDNVTSIVTCEPSSRSAMAVCLTDGTTETFWESGDEDRNRSKVISIMVNTEMAEPVLLLTYIDNDRDEGHRTSHVSIYASSAAFPRTRNKLHAETLDSRFCGWIKCHVGGFARLFLELKGSDPSVRVHSLCLLGRWLPGLSSHEKDDAHHASLKPSSSHSLQFTAAQTDAFFVFQAIAAQAFSNELCDDQGHGSLRQQVVDILFSKSQLQSLQSYVCSQIVLALERELDLLQSQNKRNYSYCCGLLGMLARISSSRPGKDIFGHRTKLLPVLSELLLFTSPLIQCQTLDTLEKLLHLFDPLAADSKTLVVNMMAVIAKVVTLQVRHKITRTLSIATAANFLEEAQTSWHLNKSCSSAIGKVVCTFLVDAASGRFGFAWCSAMRSHVASAIADLSNLSETKQEPEACLKTNTFWLALASMTVLRDRNWLEDASPWQTYVDQKNLQLCENHDDGKTAAQLYCQECSAYYCHPCYSVLHLNRKNKNHSVKMNDIRPDLNVHEGCCRLRLPWLLILLDGTTLNGMVEFMPQANNGAAVVSNLCRFCQNVATSNIPDVCSHEDCQALAAMACTSVLTCGHVCGGVINELECLPCLKCQKEPSLKQDADDLCVICFTDRLGAAPSIQLACGHVFHAHCCKAILTRRWSGPRITFAFMRCPLCQILIQHPSLDGLLKPLISLYEEVSQKAKLRLEYDGLLKADGGESLPTDPQLYALERYVYVLCHKCKRAYFGGEAQCQDALATSDYNPEELLCGACSDIAGAQICPRHGTDFLEYKCRYCCSVAVFFCFGSTHFCAGCHDDFQRLLTLPMQKLPQCPVGPKCVQLEGVQCPLKIQHPDTGTEFALGCGICRNLSTF